MLQVLAIQKFHSGHFLNILKATEVVYIIQV